MKKGITPVVSIVMLLIIAVAVVGLAYGFISGFFSTVTGKAAIVSGAGSCSTDGHVTITISNVGSDSLETTDMTVVAKSGSNAVWPGDWDITDFDGGLAPGSAGQLTENSETTNQYCEDGICTYDVVVGGTVHPVRADC